MLVTEAPGLSRFGDNETAFLTCELPLVIGHPGCVIFMTTMINILPGYLGHFVLETLGMKTVLKNNNAPNMYHFMG
jgi:hypothetical protein